MDKKSIIAEMRGHKKTYAEIGDILGITKQRVHQIYKGYDSSSPNRDVAIRRDKYRCAVCDNLKNIEVHHIDGNRKNNTGRNLVSLCRKCHVRVELLDRKYIKSVEPRFRRATIRDCIRCGRKDNAYFVRKMCGKCYIKWWRHRKTVPVDKLGIDEMP